MAPSRRRGMVIGVIGAAATLGHVICTGIVPKLVAVGGWRSVYFVGIVPLLIIAFARRNLRNRRHRQPRLVLLVGRALRLVGLGQAVLDPTVPDVGSCGGQLRSHR